MRQVIIKNELKNAINGNKVPFSQVEKLGNTNNVYVDRAVIKKLGLVEKATNSLRSYKKKAEKKVIIGPTNMTDEQWQQDLRI